MTTAQMTPAERIAQLAAEFAYACGTCTDNRVAVSDSPLYKLADQVYAEAMSTAFGLTTDEAHLARERLAEYGPHDGTYGTGFPADVRGHAALARQSARERTAAQAEQRVHEANPAWAANVEQAEWRISYQGEAVHFAWLADFQVGAMIRELPGSGWTAEPLGYVLADQGGSEGISQALADAGVKLAKEECGLTAGVFGSAARCAANGCYLCACEIDERVGL